MDADRSAGDDGLGSMGRRARVARRALREGVDGLEQDGGEFSHAPPVMNAKDGLDPAFAEFLVVAVVVLVDAVG